MRTVSEQFAQNAVTAAQATEAERSIVVSRFEEAEHADHDRRTLRNDNHCHAVTYFVRRVNEVYEVSHPRGSDRVAGRRRAVALDRRHRRCPTRCAKRSSERPRAAAAAGRVSARPARRSRCRPTARSTRPSSPTAPRASPRARKRRGSRWSEAPAGAARVPQDRAAGAPHGQAGDPGRLTRVSFTTVAVYAAVADCRRSVTRSSAPPRCRPRARSTRRPR